MKVAVVWNHDRTGIVNRFGQPRPMQESASEPIGSIVTALQEAGHETLLCEGDKGLLATLEQFMPPSPRAPSGIVFNMAYGIQGDCRGSHVPAMLEMAGIPYTGPSPFACGMTQDKVVTKKLIRDSGVPTPNFRVMRRGTESTGDLRFPVVVKPRRESSSLGLQLVHEPARLRQAVETVVMQYEQDALVEEYIEGREICVALLGNNELEVLPLVELDFGDRETRLVTWEDKNHMAVAQPQKVCPAQIGTKLATILRDVSIATFRDCLCRDHARVDLRIDRSGLPFVLEINVFPSLNVNGTYAMAAATAGYSFPSLVNRILDVAHTRYFGIAPPSSSASDSGRLSPS